MGKGAGEGKGVGESRVQAIREGRWEARDETRPRGPETRPAGSQGDPKHATTLACHGGAPIEWKLGPKLPNSRVFGEGKGAGKGAGK